MMRSSSGFALLLTIFLLLFVALLFVAIFDLLTTDIQISENQNRDTRTLYIAEAGIEDAIYNLIQDDNWTSDGSTDVEFPAGSGDTYTVTYPVDSDIIRSLGTLASGYSKTIEAEVLVSGTSPPFSVRIRSWQEQ